MKNKKKHLGQEGEKVAYNYLLQNGYKIINHNFFSPYGEIDLIAIKNSQLIFIEVKTRSSNLENALSSVSKTKQKRISKTASYFINKNPQYENHITRFDVIAIIKNKNRSNRSGVKHLENAFLPQLF